MLLVAVYRRMGQTAADLSGKKVALGEGLKEEVL